MLASLLFIALQSAPAVADEPSTPISSPAATKATEKLIELRALLESDQCEKLVALSPYIEDHRLATQAERHEAMFARAYCLVSSFGNIAEAGTVFQEILEEDIKANPPFDVEPKFQFLVDGSRASLIEAQRAKAEAEHAKKVARIELELSGTPNVKGGNRVFFDVRLTDPDAVVKSMRVNFRKQGEREYYALPVRKKSEAWWRGEVPGTYTRSSTGMKVEWFLTLSDEQGDALKTAGTRDKPHVLDVLPGSAIAEDLKANERLPQYGRLFFAVGAPLALTAGTFAVAVAASGLVESPAVLAVSGLFLPMFANYFVSVLLLDASEALIPPLVCFAISGIVTLSVVLDYSAYTYLVELDGPPDFQGGDVHGGALIGLGAMVLASIATSAATTTLVLLDAPADE